MKAWFVSDKYGDSGHTICTFSETRGKAIEYARRTEEFFDYEFTEMRALRAKQFDKYYKNGKYEMDWFDDDDRIALVKEGGFSCSYEFDLIDNICSMCPAAEWCDRWQSHLEAQEERTAV